MSVPLDAHQTLDRDFLVVRARLLEIAAALDRIHRASGSVTDDPRMENIEQAISMLASPGSGRAEKIQRVFSLPYDEQWLERLSSG